MLWTDGAAWIRGRLVPIGDATIHVTDWGLTHSDITYDVVSVWDGGFFRLSAHLDRFSRSLAKARLTVPESTAEMRDILHRIVAVSGLQRAYVAMVASRGGPVIPGTRDPRYCGNHFYAWCVPYVWVIPEEVAVRGARLWVSTSIRRIPDDSVDPTVKNYMWGDFTQALFEAKDRGFDTAVLIDHQDRVTEGPGFNVFAVFGNDVVTPATGALEGITRKTMLEIAAEHGLTPRICDRPFARLAEADEVFTATTGGGPAPVIQINDRVFSNGAPGAVTRALMERFEAWRLRPDLREEIDYPCPA